MYENVRIYRVYEVIDIDTGQVLKKHERKNYKTIKIEKDVRNIGKNRIETTRRIVKHNGQQELFN